MRADEIDIGPGDGGHLDLVVRPGQEFRKGAREGDHAAGGQPRQPRGMRGGALRDAQLPQRLVIEAGQNRHRDQQRALGRTGNRLTRRIDNEILKRFGVVPSEFGVSPSDDMGFGHSGLPVSC